MASYKLYYFNARGAVEPIRIMFAQAGVKYEDIRFEGEDWKNNFKPGTSHKQNACTYEIIADV